jgi:hypothetical protein
MRHSKSAIARAAGTAGTVLQPPELQDSRSGLQAEPKIKANATISPYINASNSTPPQGTRGSLLLWRSTGLGSAIEHNRQGADEHNLQGAAGKTALPRKFVAPRGFHVQPHWQSRS